MRRAASTAIQQLTRRPSVACQFNLFSSSHLLWLPDSQAGWAHSAEASHPESLEANANEDAFADFDFDDGAIAKGLSNFENKLFVDPKKVPAEAQSPASSPQTLSKVLPVVNPFAHQVVSRDRPAIKQLLNAGFIIDEATNLIMLPDDKSILDLDLSKVKNLKSRNILVDLLEDPAGEALLRQRCLVAKQVVNGTFIPPKLVSLPDPILEEIEMTADQHNICTLARAGYSLYIGGSAGTGKTMLLKSIHRELTAMGLKVAMTATTGVAGVQLGGNTFHSAFSVPMRDNGRWDTTSLRVLDTVIIDEVSLLGRQMLEDFNRAAQIARLSNAPFGGLQVILCGDFLQLSHEERNGVFDPCYASQLFKHFIALQLVTPLRHKEGDALLGLLRKLRVGDYDPLIETLDQDPPADSSPVYIFPKRRSVITVNSMKLSSLTTEMLVFTPQCGPTRLVGSFTQSLLCRLKPRFDKAALVRRLLDLLRDRCPDSRATEAAIVIMPARGSDDLFCLRLRQPKSGALFEAISPTPRHVWASVVDEAIRSIDGTIENAFDNGEPEELIPYSVLMSGNMSSYSAENTLQLKVGCRVMVNRNLSRTVNNGAIGTVEAFEPLNQSLVPKRGANGTRASLTRTGFEKMKTFERLPLVRLQSGELIQIPPVNESIGGESSSYYYGHDLYTLPLQLGYAFTVHKVQGLTIEGPIVVNCEDYFHCPHLIYVACSRAKQLSQLTIKGVNKHQVVVSQPSLAFAESLAPATGSPVITEDHIVCDWYRKASQSPQPIFALGDEDD